MGRWGKEGSGENEGRGEVGGSKEGNPWGSGDMSPEKDRLQVDESLTSGLHSTLHRVPARCRPSPAPPAPFTWSRVPLAGGRVGESQQRK